VVVAEERLEYELSIDEPLILNVLNFAFQTIILIKKLYIKKK